MSLSSEITRISNAKAALKTSINNKLSDTQTKIDTETIDDYSTFVDAIEQGGGSEPVIESLSITSNGTYTAPSGVDGYSPITVEVPESVLISKEIEANGTYNASDDNADGFMTVVVDVPETTATLITKSVNANGTYKASDDDADGYSEVIVTVPGTSTISQVGNLYHLFSYRGTMANEFVENNLLTNNNDGSMQYTLYYAGYNSDDSLVKLSTLQTILESKDVSLLHYCCSHTCCTDDLTNDITITLSQSTSNTTAIYAFANMKCEDKTHNVTLDCGNCVFIPGQTSSSYLAGYLFIANTLFDTITNLKIPSKLTSLFGMTTYSAASIINISHILFDSNYQLGYNLSSDWTFYMNLLNPETYTASSFMETMRSLADNTKGNTITIVVNSTMGADLTEAEIAEITTKGYTLAGV